MRALIADLQARARARSAMPREVAPPHGHIDGVPDALAIEIDANGSPVTLQPQDWLVCFVPGLRKQWWHRFVHTRHKHVFAMRMVDEQTWIIVEPWWTRLMVNVLSFDEAVKFLRWGAVGSMIKVRESIPGRGCQMRGWSNCAVLISFLLGRSYWTWTPNGLYKKLLAEEGVQPIDVPRLLVEHIGSSACKAACGAMVPMPQHDPVPLDRLLLRLGNAIVSAMTSAPAIGLHKVAVSESGRFRDATDAYWIHGMERMIEHVRGVLEGAQARGEIRIADRGLAARQFIAMLRGDMQMEMLFGIRATTPLSTTEIQAHVTSVVDVFLYGAGIAARHEHDVAPAGICSCP